MTIDEGGSLDPEAAATVSDTSPKTEPQKSRSALLENDNLPLTHKPEKVQQTVDGSDHSNNGNSKSIPPRLIHSSLHRIPMQVRYIVYGIISSAVFVVMYNAGVEYFGHLYVPSTIYAASYALYIPIQHALSVCLVFGWPARYWSSLISNVPIALTAIALGSYLTAYLDKIKFNDSMEAIVKSLMDVDDTSKDDDSKNEFYTSLLVLIVTSFWSFVLSVFVNTQPESLDKKEL